MQVTQKFDDYKLLFMKVMKQYEAMWDEHLSRITIDKHSIVSNLPIAPHINLAPYSAGPDHQKLKCEEKDENKGNASQ